MLFFRKTSLKSITLNDKITGIPAYCFYNTKITKIVLPNSVRSIGDSAFANTPLININIPSNLTNIGGSAFANCQGLKSFYLNDRINYIGMSAFSNCQNLSSLVIDGDNSVYDTRNNCNAIIKTNTNELIQACNTTIIPNTVKTILKFACGGLSDNIIDCYVPRQIRFCSTYRFSEQDSV